MARSPAWLKGAVYAADGTLALEASAGAEVNLAMARHLVQEWY